MSQPGTVIAFSAAIVCLISLNSASIQSPVVFSWCVQLQNETYRYFRRSEASSKSSLPHLVDPLPSNVEDSPAWRTYQSGEAAKVNTTTVITWITYDAGESLEGKREPPLELCLVSSMMAAVTDPRWSTQSTKLAGLGATYTINPTPIICCAMPTINPRIFGWAHSDW